MGKSLIEHCTEHQMDTLISQWHFEKNLPITPDSIPYGSNQKVWWICEKGHTWQAAVTARVHGNDCPYCSGRLAISGENDLATTHPALARQWHPTKNGALTPSMVKAGGNQKVWWIDELGHEWQALIRARSAGNGCPYCTNRIALKGFNDLATTHPQFAAQMHPTKNGDLTPEKITAGHQKMLWWLCDKGHEWHTTISSRIRHDAGCPVCANRIALPGFNDLQTTHPHIAAQWHPTKNGTLTPRDVVAGSESYIWWQCERGHAWRTKLKHRSRNSSDCPYCTGKKVLPGFNDLQTVNPKIAEQWHPFLNGTLTPQMVTTGSSRLAWWVCGEGHVWRTAIVNRALPGYKETDCPFCQKMTKRSRKQEYYKRIELEAMLSLQRSK